ncbi:hypothetical protein ACAN107058_21095 [Paracidovorax anthurii]
MRQDTPSTIRWCATSSRRASPPGSVTAMARSSGPCSRSRLHWACSHNTLSCAGPSAARSQSISSHCAPAISSWRRTQPLGPCAEKPCRNAPWCRATARSASRRARASSGSALRSSTDWFQCCRTGIGIAKKSRWNGSNSTSPCASPAAALAAGSACSTPASCAMVWRSKSWRGVALQPASLNLATICRLRIESPPSSKKFSSRPTPGRPSTSLHTASSASSRGPWGAPPLAAPVGSAGSGSALRSTLPLALSGKAGSTMKSAGTM